MKKTLFVLVMCLFFAVSASAEFTAKANVQAGQGAKKTSGTASIGSVTINGITYQKIEVQPVFRFGKLSAGLNVRLYLDSDNKLKDANGDGKPDGWETWRDVISKILYIQYASKGARPLYARLGDIYNANIGHGFIMQRFNNALNRNERRKIGMEFDPNFAKFGIETVTNDVTKFDIIGVRPTLRPFSSSSINLLRNLGFGVTYVADRNIVSNFDYVSLGFNKNEYDADKDGKIDADWADAHNITLPETDVDVSFDNPYAARYNELKNQKIEEYGFDVETILFQNAIITAKIYGDFAAIRNYGNGFAFPGVEGTLFGFLRMKGEFRSYDYNFVPSLFDAYYERDRMILQGSNIVTIKDKLDALPKTGRLQGGYFRLDYSWSNYFSFVAAYENYMNAQARIYSVIEVKPALIQRYSNQRLGMKMSYEQKNLPKIRDFTFLNENTVMQTVISYGISANVDMKYYYIKTFDAYGKATDSTSVEMSMRF